MGFRARSTPERALGFSILEMLIVLVLISLVLSAGLLFFRPGQPSLRILSVALVSELNAAREIAISRDQPVEVLLDRDGKGYRRSGARNVVMPEGIRIRLGNDNAVARQGAHQRLIFFPDGSSTGGIVKLNGRGKSVAVRVDWMSGAVTIGNGL